MSKLVPKLSFEGFSGEWEEKKLNQVCDVIMGQSPSSNNYNSDGIGTPLIQGNADIKNRKTFIRIWTTETKKTCKIDDIILTVRAPVGYVAKSLHNASIGRGVCAIKSNKNTTNNFLYQYLLRIESKWEELGQGSTFTAISTNDIKNLKIIIPKSQKEQQKIASCLSSLDSLIEAQNKKVEALKKHKKGLMQQLFPKEGERVPTLRFDGFSGEWEEKDFEKIFNRIASKKYQIKSDEYLERGKYPVIDQGKSKIIAYSNDKGKLFINDNIILFGDHTRILKYIDFNFIVGADGTQLIKAREGYNNKFLYYQLLKNKIPNTGYNRHFKFIKDMSFFVPKQKEQQKIASCLSSLDSLIEANEQKVKALKKHKKGLMQQMFVSGER